MTKLMPLSGLHYLITRPQPAAQALAHAMEQQGSTTTCFPTINITPDPQHPSVIHAAEQLSHQNSLIFTSAPAVHAFFAGDKQPHTTTNIYAIGPATATACIQHGLSTPIVPENYHSESLLNHSHLQQVSGQHITIFCGHDPKPLLAETLKARGAIVTLAYCYRRDLPPAPMPTEWNHLLSPHYHAIITTSADCLKNLVSLCTEHLDWLLEQQLIVIRDTMVQQAKDYGFEKTPWLSPSATNTAIIKTTLMHLH